MLCKLPLHSLLESFGGSNGKAVAITVPNGSDSEWEGLLTQYFAVPAIFTIFTALPLSGYATGLVLQEGSTLVEYVPGTDPVDALFSFKRPPSVKIIH